MSYNRYCDYRIQTVTCESESSLDKYTEYRPIFGDDGALDLLASFLTEEVSAFPDEVLRVVRQAVKDPYNEIYTFTGNVYYMRIVYRTATIDTNFFDKEDKRPLVTVDTQDLLELVQQWNADIKFLKKQMDMLPERQIIIAAYLQTKYGYTHSQLANEIAYLMHTREIAIEFLYYIRYNRFIPERYASVFSGFTAEKLKKEFGLSTIGAFNYMAHLKYHPNSAIAKQQMIFVKGDDTMTLKEFTSMARSCNSPITVILFSDVESAEDFRQTKDAELALLKFQSTYQSSVFLRSEFANAKVEAFYGVSKDTYHVIVEIKGLQ